MANVPVKGADSATYNLALPSLGSTPAAGALSVIPSPDGTHAKTADITALSAAITGALAATQTVSVTGTAAVTQSGSWTVAFAPGSTVALAGGNTVALKVDGSGVTQPVSLATGSAVAVSNFPATQAVTGPALGSPTDAAWDGTSASASIVSVLKGLPRTAGGGTGGSVAVTSLPALVAGTATIGSVNVLGGNATAVKVDGSATIQPVSGTVAASQSGAWTVALSAGASVSVSNFPATQTVSGTVALGAGTAAIGSITNAFALDATITARLGTLGQKASAASAPVVIASDQSSIPTAPAAGENHLGSVGSDSKRISVAPTLTPGTYATGKCLGGLVTLSSLLRVAGKSATVQSATVHAKVANTSQIDVVLFRAVPTGSTAGLTDNATFAVDPADFDKVSKVLSFTTWNSLGTPSLSRLDGIGSLVSAATGTDLQAILVARGSVVISTASDLSIGLGVYQD